MVISISGPAGSGTTTIAKIIAAKYNLEHVYAGQMIRDLAAARNMSIYEFNEYIEAHPDIDREVDDTIVRKAREGNKIVEGRLSAWMMMRHAIPALKLYFTIDPAIAARRVSQRDHISIEEALTRNAQREQRHWDRFHALYAIEKDDVSVYDVTIDTSALPIDAVTAHVERLIIAYQSNN